MKYDYNLLVKALQNTILTITFKKVDGTERVMKCTLKDGFLPEEYRGKAPMITEQAPLTLSVWDLEASGWRSFRLDSITNVS